MAIYLNLGRLGCVPGGYSWRRASENLPSTHSGECGCKKENRNPYREGKGPDTLGGPVCGAG
jgi:hypothetical protein